MPIITVTLSPINEMASRPGTVDACTLTLTPDRSLEYKVGAPQGLTVTLYEAFRGPPGPPGSGADSFSGVCVGTVDGVNTIFGIPSTPAAGSLSIYRNGVRQALGDDYTVAGLLITFSWAPKSGDSIEYTYLQ